MFVCTKCTTSRRMGAPNTAGSGTLPDGFPAASYTVTVGRTCERKAEGGKTSCV